jgi:hypothetical protein
VLLLSSYFVKIQCKYSFLCLAPTTTIDEQTVTGVLNRHNWTDIGAAIDVTGSMSGCYAQIDQWMALSETNKLVQYFAFFNDGDSTPDKDKVIGSTGKRTLKRRK